VAGLLWLALAEHGRGRPEDGRKALEQATALLDPPSPDDGTKTRAARLPWEERVETEVLRAEAEGLLRPAKP
jgi:hypothetical protein